MEARKERDESDGGVGEAIDHDDDHRNKKLITSKGGSAPIEREGWRHHDKGIAIQDGSGGSQGMKSRTLESSPANSSSEEAVAAVSSSGRGITSTREDGGHSKKNSSSTTRSSSDDDATEGQDDEALSASPAGGRLSSAPATKTSSPNSPSGGAIPVQNAGAERRDVTSLSGCQNSHRIKAARSTPKVAPLASSKSGDIIGPATKRITTPSVTSSAAEASTVGWKNTTSNALGIPTGAAPQASVNHGLPMTIPPSVAPNPSMNLPSELAQTLALVLQARQQQQLPSNVSHPQQAPQPWPTANQNNSMMAGSNQLPGLSSFMPAAATSRGISQPENPNTVLEQLILNLFLQGAQQQASQNQSNGGLPASFQQQQPQQQQQPLGNIMSQFPGVFSQSTSVPPPAPFLPVYHPPPPPQLAAPHLDENVAKLLLQQLGLYRPDPQASTADPFNMVPPARMAPAGQSNVNILPSLQQLIHQPQQGPLGGEHSEKNPPTDSSGYGGKDRQHADFPPSRPLGGHDGEHMRKQREMASSRENETKLHDTSRRSSQGSSSNNREEGVKASSDLFPALSAAGGGLDDANTMGTILLPCGARGMPPDHNFKNAFLVIVKNVRHGDELECSYDACRRTGVKFRYCSICRIPVAKRNFHQRHSHGIPIPSTSEFSSPVPGVTEKQDQHTGSLSVEAQRVEPPPKREDRKELHGVAKARRREESSSSSSSEEDRPHDRRSSHKKSSDRQTSSQVVNSTSRRHKDSKTNQPARSNPSETALSRQWRWASLLGRRPRADDTDGMASWLLEVMAISDLSKPVNALGTSSLTNSSAGLDRSFNSSTNLAPAVLQAQAQTLQEDESTSEEAHSSLTSSGGTTSGSNGDMLDERERQRRKKHNGSSGKDAAKRSGSRKRSRSRSNKERNRLSNSDEEGRKDRKKKYRHP